MGDPCAHQGTKYYSLTFFCRSQKTNRFAKELGGFLKTHGISRNCMNSGPVLGYSASPRSIDRSERENLKQFPSKIRKMISDSLRVKKYMLNIRIVQYLLCFYTEYILYIVMLGFIVPLFL